jgi:hypothetical protein
MPLCLVFGTLIALDYAVLLPRFTMEPKKTTKYLFSTSEISQLAGGSLDFIEFYGVNCAKLSNAASDGPVFSQGEIVSGVCFPKSQGRISGQFQLKEKEKGSFEVHGEGVFSIQCPNQSLFSADIVINDIFSKSSDRGQSLMVASGSIKNINYMPFKHPLLAELAMVGQAEIYFIFRSEPEGNLEDLEDFEASEDYADEVLS